MSHLDTPFSIEDQIQLMRKYVVFTRKTKIRRYLEYAGYFRLSRYGKYLLSHTGTLKTKPKQDLLFDVYDFDVELRNLFFHYCKKAEIQFKSHMSNSISLKESNAFFYLDKTFYNEAKSDKNRMKRESNKKRFNKFFKNLTTQERVLRSNVNKYPELKEYRTGGIKAKRKIPCWAAFSYFEFGTISMMYSYLRGDLRKNVLTYGYSKRRYGKETTKQMDTWLDSVRNLRNACTHHSQIVGRASSIVLLDTEDDPSILKSDTDLFSRIYSLKKVLKPEDSEHLKKDLKKMIEKAKFDVYLFGIFPDDWEQLFDRIKYL